MGGVYHFDQERTNLSDEQEQGLSAGNYVCILSVFNLLWQPRVRPPEKGRKEKEGLAATED